LQSSKNGGREILALGAESDGNFSTYFKGSFFHSRAFGDLLIDTNFRKFKREVLRHLAENDIKPKVILSDLHPDFKTTTWAEKLARRFKANHIKIQHHLAHVFSVFGENFCFATADFEADGFVGVACDGTGYGLDGNIWGGEVFRMVKLPAAKFGQPLKFGISRVAHLENQVLIGGDLAIKEPARMLFSILAKFLKPKDLRGYFKNFYSKNQLDLLYSQLQQNFNCQKTSSTGRVLDAASVLLGFATNQRRYKHEPIDLLERNSGKPYKITPKLAKLNDKYYLATTPLFEYLVRNLKKDRRRLAATVQFYIAKGLAEIIRIQNNRCRLPVYFAGGIANNKIISGYLRERGVVLNRKLPRGDAGISFGQIFCFLLTDSGD
jgi:hydrogenase maturation protein HypF